MFSEPAFKVLSTRGNDSKNRGFFSFWAIFKAL